MNARYSINTLDRAVCPTYYLHEKVSGKVTDRVHRFKDYLPDYFPLVHPSPRNQIWMAKNTWFESEVVPELQALVQKIIHQ